MASVTSTMERTHCRRRLRVFDAALSGSKQGATPRKPPVHTAPVGAGGTPSPCRRSAALRPIGLLAVGQKDNPRSYPADAWARLRRCPPYETDAGCVRDPGAVEIHPQAASQAVATKTVGWLSAAKPGERWGSRRSGMCWASPFRGQPKLKKPGASQRSGGAQRPFPFRHERGEAAFGGSTAPMSHCRQWQAAVGSRLVWFATEGFYKNYLFSAT